MGIPARDFMNLSLTDIETIAAFGQWRNFSKEQVRHASVIISPLSIGHN